MNKIPFPTPERICFAGDWHGSTSAGVEAIKYASKHQAEVIIQLGDFGFWGDERSYRYIKKLNNEAKREKIKILWIDGNHENFNKLNNIPISEVTGLRHFGDHIFHLPRNYRWSWGGLTFHSLGGGTSLDRLNRTLNINWFEEEAISDSEAEDAKSLGYADILLTHDCPDGVDIPGIDRLTSLRRWPEITLREAWRHRERLAEIASHITPRYIFHGHFHIPYQSRFNFTDIYETVITGLGHEDYGVNGNLKIIKLEELIS